MPIRSFISLATVRVSIVSVAAQRRRFENRCLQFHEMVKSSNNYLEEDEEADLYDKHVNRNNSSSYKGIYEYVNVQVCVSIRVSYSVIYLFFFNSVQGRGRVVSRRRIRTGRSIRRRSSGGGARLMRGTSFDFFLPRFLSDLFLIVCSASEIKLKECI